MALANPFHEPATPERSKALSARGVSVVVPTFREAENLGALVERLEVLRRSAGLDLELVIVDDDSGDGTPDIVRGLGREWVRMIVRRGERGLSSAVLCGIGEARHETIVVMDADLSHPPEAIPALVAALDAGAEMAIGSRRVKGGSMEARWPLVRRVMSRTAALLARPLTGVSDPTSGYFAFRRGLIRLAEPLRPIGYKIGLELMVRSRIARVDEVPIHFADRVQGQSKLSWRVRLDYLRHLARLTLFKIARPAFASQPCNRRARRANWLFAMLLVLLVGVTFGRTIGHDLLEWDDRFHTVDNPHFAPLNVGSLTHFWSHQYGNLYIPVAYNAFAGDMWLSESITGQSATVMVDARVFHATNIALHAIATLLVFCILKRLGIAPVAAALGAGVFAVHPLQTETVAWISETRGLLAAVFSFAAACVHVSERRGWMRTVLAVVLFTLGVLSKPSAVAIPAMMLAIDVMWRGIRIRTALLRLLPWFGVAIAALLVTRALQSGEGITTSTPWWTRPFIAGDTLAFYVEKLAIPFGLAPDYSRTPAAVMGAWWGYVTWLLPVACIIAAAWSSHRRALLTGGAIALCGVAPVLGLLPFDHQNISTVADRYIYLSMLGLALATAAIAGSSSRRVQVVVGVLVALFAIRSLDQARHWQSDILLWSHNVQVNPASALALNNLGNALGKAERFAEADATLQRAIAINPGSAMALTNLGWIRDELGRPAEAIQFYARSLAINSKDARAHNGLGRVLAESGDLAEAIPHFQQAVRLNPRDAEAASNLGLALTQAGNAADGIAHLETAVRLSPSSHLGRHNLGLALDALGRYGEAIASYVTATRLNPTFVPSYLRLGDDCARVGHLDEARAAYERALAVEPGNAEAANNLGLVLIRLDRLSEAVTAFEHAVVNNPESAEARDNLKNARVLVERKGATR